MKKPRKIIRIITNVIIWIFVAFAVTATVTVIAARSDADGVPTIGGRCFLAVRSDSMTPTFKRGDLIVGEMLTDVEKQTLSVGEVITFHADLNGDGMTELNSHRIVRINKGDDGRAVSYVTRGDNPVTNAEEDKRAVAWQYVVCRWSGGKVGALGGVLSFMQTPKGFFLSVVIPIMIFFLYALYSFITAVIKYKSGEGRITSAEVERIKQKAIEEYIQKQTEKASDNSDADKIN
ncbi:MAG: signal peptidase I [Ruminococcaceae bacterium]|nr:signal peptidase I [Oscillospiraceae bacterium]